MSKCKAGSIAIACALLSIGCGGEKESKSPDGPATIPELAAALLAALNTGDAAAAARLVATEDQLAQWWSCDGEPFLDKLRKKSAALRNGLPRLVSEGSCKGDRCTLASDAPPDSAAPRSLFLRAGEPFKGCTPRVDITAHSGQWASYRLEPAGVVVLSCEITGWVVNGRAYLLDLDCPTDTLRPGI